MLSELWKKKLHNNKSIKFILITIKKEGTVVWNERKIFSVAQLAGVLQLPTQKFDALETKPDNFAKLLIVYFVFESVGFSIEI